MLRISTENAFWGAWIRIAILFFLSAVLGQHFSEELVDSAIFDKELLNKLILLGYAVCMVIVVFVVLRTEIIFHRRIRKEAGR